MKEISIATYLGLQPRLGVLETSSMSAIRYDPCPYLKIWKQHTEFLQTLTSSQQTPPYANVRNQPVLNQQPSTFTAPSNPGPSGLPQSQNFAQGSGQLSGYAPSSAPGNDLSGSPQNQTFPSIDASGPPQLPPAQTSTPFYSQPATPIGMGALQNNSSTSLPALRPVFGLSLEDLLKRDGSAIPLVVYQCIQAVDLYGLEVEGIYRLSGSSIHVSKLRSIFDNGMVRPNCSYSIS